MWSFSSSAVHQAAPLIFKANCCLKVHYGLKRVQLTFWNQCVKKDLFECDCLSFCVEIFGIISKNESFYFYWTWNWKIWRFETNTAEEEDLFKDELAIKCIYVECRSVRLESACEEVVDRADLLDFWNLCWKLTSKLQCITFFLKSPSWNRKGCI